MFTEYSDIEKREFFQNVIETLQKLGLNKPQAYELCRTMGPGKAEATVRYFKDVLSKQPNVTDLLLRATYSQGFGDDYVQEEIRNVFLNEKDVAVIREFPLRRREGSPEAWRKVISGLVYLWGERDKKRLTLK